MVVIRKSELHRLNRHQRMQRLEELRKQLLEFRSSLASGGSISNPGKIVAIRRTIARIMTLNHEEWLREQKTAAAAAPAAPASTAEATQPPQ